MSNTPTNEFDQWCILELLGHVRVAGRVTEEERFGIKMGRIDIPQTDGSTVTQYFGGGSVYRLTPTTEEIARQVAIYNAIRPVNSWELRPALNAATQEAEIDIDADEFHDNENDDDIRAF